MFSFTNNIVLVATLLLIPTLSLLELTVGNDFLSNRQGIIPATYDSSIQLLLQPSHAQEQDQETDGTEDDEDEDENHQTITIMMKKAMRMKMMSNWIL